MKNKTPKTYQDFHAYYTKLPTMKQWALQREQYGESEGTLGQAAFLALAGTNCACEAVWEAMQGRKRTPTRLEDDELGAQRNLFDTGEGIELELFTPKYAPITPLDKPVKAKNKQAELFVKSSVPVAPPSILQYLDIDLNHNYTKIDLDNAQAESANTQAELNKLSLTQLSNLYERFRQYWWKPEYKNNKNGYILLNAYITYIIEALAQKVQEMGLYKLPTEFLLNKIDFINVTDNTNKLYNLQTNYIRLSEIEASHINYWPALFLIGHIRKLIKTYALEYYTRYLKEILKTPQFQKIKERVEANFMVPKFTIETFQQTIPSEEELEYDYDRDPLLTGPKPLNIAELYNQYLLENLKCAPQVNKKSQQFAEFAKTAGIPKAQAERVYREWALNEAKCSTKFVKEAERFKAWLIEQGHDPESPALQFEATDKPSRPLMDNSSGNFRPSADVYAYQVPLSQIQTDPQRFQNRLSDFSEDSVNRIVDNYDPNQLDPITVWQDPADGIIYVLSGHSRLEAHHRLGKQTIPAKFFEGNEAQAVEFARVLANRAATPESIIEDINAYRLLRDGDPARGIKPAPKNQLKKTFGRKTTRLEAYTYLHPSGKFITALSNPAVAEQTPKLELIAAWVGDIAAGFPGKVNVNRETEIFDWLYDSDSAGYTKPKEVVYSTIEAPLKNRFLAESEPLNLKGNLETGVEARRDTSAAAKRLRQIDQETSRLRITAENPNITAEARNELIRSVKELLKERQKLEEEISEVLRTQTGLFGTIPRNEIPPHLKPSFARLKELEKEVTQYQKRKAKTNPWERIWTPEERAVINRLEKDARTEMEKIRKDLHIANRYPQLFA